MAKPQHLKNILIINGPNLNLLGIREPEIYGKETFESYFAKLEDKFPQVALNYYQSNHEGDIIDKLQEVGFIIDGIILNAGGFTHTSVAISDAVKAIITPVVEVHISNIYEREDFRKKSFLKAACVKTIYGKGMPGYDEAVSFLLNN
jgi:3-dehydroquinate dehydratase-2